MKRLALLFSVVLIIAIFSSGCASRMAHGTISVQRDGVGVTVGGSTGTHGNNGYYPGGYNGTYMGGQSIPPGTWYDHKEKKLYFSTTPRGEIFRISQGFESNVWRIEPRTTVISRYFAGRYQPAGPAFKEADQESMKMHAHYFFGVR